MKKFVTLFTVAIMMAVFTAGSQPTAAANSSSTQLLTVILDKVARAGQQLKSLQANLSQQKINTQLGIKDPIEIGVIYYKPLGNGKSQLRIDYINPEPKTLIVNGDFISFYQPIINQAFESTAKNLSKGQAGALISFTINTSMRNNYNIDLGKDEVINGKKTTQLIFTPKNLPASQIKRLEVWIDNDTWLPIKHQFTERNNDITWVALSDLKQNVPLPGNQFKPTYKAGTKVVKG